MSRSLDRDALPPRRRRQSRPDRRHRPKGTEESEIERGMVLLPRHAEPTATRSFEAEVMVLNHPTRIREGYEPVVHLETLSETAIFTLRPANCSPATPEPRRSSSSSGRTSLRKASGLCSARAQARVSAPWCRPTPSRMRIRPLLWTRWTTLRRRRHCCSHPQSPQGLFRHALHTSAATGARRIPRGAPRRSRRQRRCRRRRHRW